MSKIHQDINDDEIRIISSGNKGDATPSPRPTHKLVIAFCVAIALVALVAILYLFIVGDDSQDNPAELELIVGEPVASEVAGQEVLPDSPVVEAMGNGYVIIADTIINGVGMTMFNPVDATPTLHIGTDVLNDSTVKFVVQAADVRGDNGGIVGAYVTEGELISKGQAKAGFCAIIGGKITVGVADATPFLEQALETDGYFFRQYPLVVANQVVENKPKGKALRKALAELNGNAVVIMSKERMTFHDFSQSLVDLGVTNAIYLVGGKSYGFAIGPNGERTEFVGTKANKHDNTNYIVWR